MQFLTSLKVLEIEIKKHTKVLTVKSYLINVQSLLNARREYTVLFLKILKKQ